MEYVETFSQEDPDEFLEYYTDDIIFDQAGRQQLEGKDEVRLFYEKARPEVRESVTVNHVVIGEEYIAAEIEVEFTALIDWPTVSIMMRKGETAKMRSLIHYKLRDDQFCKITAAKVEVVPPEDIQN